MRYLIILFLLPTICLASEPKLHKGDCVAYPVEEFYKNVCSGYAKVRYYGHRMTGSVYYYLTSSSENDPNCTTHAFDEKQLQLLDKEYCK